MGTNFYWLGRRKEVILPTGREVELRSDSMDPDWHIGKRSAAGLYCWNCGLTLCKGGVGAIHASTHGFHNDCPQCGAGKSDEKNGNPVLVELGFSRPRNAKPSGVRGCSSFSWAQRPSDVREACEKHMDEPIIEDEYGRTLTGSEFLEMLANNCPIEFTHSVGIMFS